MARKKSNFKEHKRSVLTIQDKLLMIKQFEKGEKISGIARSLGLPRSTVSGIVNDRKRILDYVNDKSPSRKAAIISIKRGQIFDEMENALSQWIDNQSKSGIVTNQPSIQKKAKSIFQDLLSKYPDTKEKRFIASNGWFARFKRRCSVQQISTQNDLSYIQTSCSLLSHTKDLFPQNIESPVFRNFPSLLSKVIEDGSYSPKQVFKLEKTLLFWKRLPEKCDIYQQGKSSSDFKVSKESFKLLIGGNLYGDFKLKPLLVHHFANPKAFRNIPKASLPVIWMNNTNASLSIEMFEEWFINHFIPAVRSYYREKKILFKILLILHCSSDYLTNLNDYDANVKIICYPPNTQSFVQVSDEGLVALFKRYYLCRVLNQSIDATCQPEGISFENFWKDYNLYSAILNISVVWSDLKQLEMNGVWKDLCPQYVTDSKIVCNKTNELSKELVFLSKELNMDLNKDDFKNLVIADEQPLDEEYSVQDDFSELQPRKFEESEMRKAFFHLSKCLSIFEKQDSNSERFFKISKHTEEVFQTYRNIFNEKRKSRSNDAFCNIFEK